MFSNIPTVTKNLLIINVLAYLATLLLSGMGISLEHIGGLHFFLASDFHLFQFITYQFLHSGFAHLFFNMFALWMFGCVIENVWGPKKFIFYYILCGIGAGFCQEIVQYVQYSMEGLANYEYVNVSGVGQMAMDTYLNNWLTIGASGAVYAILLAFGMTFPNERIFIFPLPVPIKAKWFVIIYAALELFLALRSMDDVAHMAHLGGMLFGFLLITYWRKHPDSRFDLGRSKQFFDRWGEKRKAQSAENPKNTWTTNNTGHSGYGPTRQDDIEYNARKKARQEEVDRILDKIRKSGYDSLTKEEKQRLFEASRER